MQNVFDTLERRGYVEQLTHPEEMKKIFETESVPFYIGIDPTADSLHVGHFISLMVASQFTPLCQDMTETVSPSFTCSSISSLRPPLTNRPSVLLI